MGLGEWLNKKNKKLDCRQKWYILNCITAVILEMQNKKYVCRDFRNIRSLPFQENWVHYRTGWTIFVYFERLDRFTLHNRYNIICWYNCLRLFVYSATVMLKVCLTCINNYFQTQQCVWPLIQKRWNLKSGLLEILNYFLS